jgi:hypothetical protein
MKNILITGISTMLIAAFASTLYADDDALSIIRKMEEMHRTESSRTRMTMLVYPDSNDKDDYRTMKIFSYTKGDDDTYMVFESPQAIKGLCILSKGGDQWVYFPSTGRVRKIAGKSKNATVQGVGGDFTYEDLGGGQFEEKYTFRITSSDTEQWEIEGIPTDADNSYSKVVVTVDRSSYLTRKISYHTTKDGHMKDLVMKDVKEIGGRLMPTTIIMINHVKQSMTVIVTNSAEYDVVIDDRYFNPTRFYK